VQASEQTLDPHPMSGVDPLVRMRAFLQGEIVLADLYELTRSELYEICEQGRVLFDGGKLEESRKVFSALTSLDPFNADFHMGLAVVHQKSGALERAVVEYDRAILLDKRHIPARCNRAEVLIQLGKYERAAKDIQAIARFDPEFQTPFGERARSIAIAFQKMIEAWNQSEA